VTDLGTISAASAAKTLLDLARRAESRSDDLVFPALLADSVTVWPDLLDLARDDDAPRSGRKAAIFWLSQEAGEAVTRELADFVEDGDMDRELREHAVFALSQLPREQGVPILIRTARSNRDPSVRRKALFWLGQSEDPRALALFEEILTKSR
jgi:HEAT repeat protein